MELGLIVVFVFSMVQCLFGMGLLVFGTPTLLILGYDFSDALVTLLPPSVAISAIQVARSRHVGKREVYNCLFYCLPFVIIFLAITLMWSESINIGYLVGLLLIGTALSRLSSRVGGLLFRALSRYEKPYLIAMGIVHGMSNMGGGMLSIYANTKCAEKRNILGVVSTYYLMFGIVQLGVLMTTASDQLIGVNTLYMILIAVGVYALIGTRALNLFRDKLYKDAFSVFMLVYSIVLFVK